MWNRKCTPQEAIERAIEWKKAHEITYHGVKYPSLPQCCEDLGINPISVRLYMEKNGVLVRKKTMGGATQYDMTPLLSLLPR